MDNAHRKSNHVLMNTPAPMVFIHSGESWYLPYALQQARLADPQAAIFLLGDSQSVEPGILKRNLKEYETDVIRQFRQLYYQNAPNPLENELVCYLRWFYLSNFLRQEALRDVFYFDSDVLVYSSGNEVKRTMLEPGMECGLSVHSQSPESCLWTACGHASYWQAAILEEFCEFCLRSYESDESLARYRTKVAWHKNEGVSGGITDMTTLYFFWEQNQHRIANLAIRKNGAMVDHNVANAANHGDDEYLMEEGIKKIRFQAGRPHVFPAPSAEPTLAHSLHFQGSCKKLMPTYYTGPAFRQKWLADKPADSKLIRSCKKRALAIKSFLAGDRSR
jgi:hypothetical protein